MSTDKKDDKWKSVKVTGKTYDQLKAMGQPFGKALETIVTAQKEALEEHVQEIGEIGRRIYEEVLARGLFNIKIAGVKISEVAEVGNDITINLSLVVEVPDADARKAIIEAVKPKAEFKKEEVKSK